MNDGRIWRVGPCAHHEDGHATEEEAERHFYDSEIQSLRETWSGADVQYRCAFPGCAAFTQKGLASTHLFMSPTWLCEVHCTPEFFEKINPFKPEIEIWASW